MKTKYPELVKLNECDEKIRSEIIEYFGAKPIGSQILNLTKRMINDIDFVVDERNKKGVIKYLKDKGYSTKKWLGRDGYLGDDIVIFEKKGCKHIDIEFRKLFGHLTREIDFKILSEQEIIKLKYERGKKSDYYQIIQVCKNKLNSKKHKNRKL